MAHSPPHRFRIDTPKMDSRIVESGSRTAMQTRQPEHVVRTLKMPLLRTDVDDHQQGTNQQAETNCAVKATDNQRHSKQLTSDQRTDVQQPEKRVIRPATVVEQLKHCLAQYELLQKQLLCAELTGTSVADQHKFEQVAAKLIRRITSLRKQLAAKGESERRPVSPKSPTVQPAIVAAKSVVTDAPKPKVASVSSKVQTKRTVKLSVSHSTAMVLKAFADAGKRPSALVERALWADRDVQDAALLLNLTSPTKQV